MNVIDARECGPEDETVGIRFDDSLGLLTFDGVSICLTLGESPVRPLVAIGDVDDLINALMLAKKLWGKNEKGAEAP